MTPFEKSERAKQLLADPVLKEALQKIKEGLIAQMESSGMDDIDTHHQAVLSLQLLKRVGSELQRFIGDAAMVEHREKQDSWLRKQVANARKLVA